MPDEFEDGFYWARIYRDAKPEVILREDGCWWVCGNDQSPQGSDIEIIERIKPPEPKS